MELHVKRAFKSYFLSLKKTKKADRLCIKFSSNSSTGVQRCLYPLFQNQRPYFLLPSLFRRISQPSGQGEQNGKQTYCRLPPYSFRINFKKTPSHTPLDSQGVYCSRIFLEFLLKPVYPTMVAEKFQIYGVKITGRVLNLFIFTHALKQIPPPGRRKLPILSEQRFLKICFS